MGIGGQTLATMLANFNAQILPQLQPGIPNYIICLACGTNDIANNGQTGAQVYTSLTSYASAVHGVGAKFIASTILDRNQSGFAAQKNAYNALLLANTAGADAIVDFTGTLLGCDGCSTDTTWFTDGVHPTQLGITTYEAPLASTAINSLP